MCLGAYHMKFTVMFTQVTLQEQLKHVNLPCQPIQNFKVGTQLYTFTEIIIIYPF